jgi:hypothetical protein
MHCCHLLALFLVQEVEEAQEVPSSELLPMA